MTVKNVKKYDREIKSINYQIRQNVHLILPPKLNQHNASFFHQVIHKHWEGHLLGFFIFLSELLLSLMSMILKI